MRRHQTIIAANFETRYRPCRIAVRAEGENPSANGRFATNMIRSRSQFRLGITLNSETTLRFSENRQPKTSNRHAVAMSFSQESTRRTATTGLLEQRP